MCTEAECRKTFVDLKTPVPELNRAVRLDRAHPYCCCQVRSVSEHSKKPVEDTEILFRVLVAPQHMNNKKLPKAGALSDAERGGLSVFRADVVKKDNIRQVAEGLVAKARSAQGSKPEKAGVFGVLRLECSVVRETAAEGEERPAYGVYDTALKDDESHAEIFQRVADAEPEIVEARRQTLFKRVAATFISVDDFMGGILKDLAPGA